MEGRNNIWLISVLFCMALAADGKRRGSSEDEGQSDQHRSHNKKGNDRSPALFGELPNNSDSMLSAQQVSPAISGYNGAGIGGQGSVLGSQALYTGLQNQGISAGLGQGVNPYLRNEDGLSSFGRFSGSTLGFGAGLQNPYSFLRIGGQGLYNQDRILGLSGLSGFTQQSELGGLSGLGGYSRNPYLKQAQNPYSGLGQIPYLNFYRAQGTGIGMHYLNNNVSPYLLSRNGAYLTNPFFGLGGSHGLASLSSYSASNPYNAFPLNSRFGFHRSGSLASRSSSAQSSSSSSDE